VDSGKIKLAESVNRFCNSEDGGLVIYGMASKKVPNDVIRRICPLPRDKGMVSRYRRVLRPTSIPHQTPTYRGRRHAG
jgi:hypothetical protein